MGNMIVSMTIMQSTSNPISQDVSIEKLWCVSNVFASLLQIFLTFVVILYSMSETEEGKNNLDEAQKNQKKAGAAENNPETTGPC
jgi:hypothetical protein